MTDASPTDVVAPKSANILAEVRDLSKLSKAALVLSDDAGTLLVYEALKTYVGGTWVGGTATLTKTELSFKPSALSFVLPTKTDASFSIPLNKIADVVVDGGFITKIIRVELPELTVRLRCYGAAEFAHKICDAAGMSNA